MKYKIIASGSTGNSVIIENKILIDCGISYKKLADYEQKLSLILLTHIHSDHFNKRTIKKIANDRPTLRFACCKWLEKSLLDSGVSKKNIDVLECGKIYDYKKFKISSVQLYHDVPQCGWRVFIGNEKAIYMTDTKTVEGISAKDYNLYLIEANYEDNELQERIKEKREQGKFAYEISVPYRHLSKEQADEFLLKNMNDNSEYVYLHQHRSNDDG